MLVLTRTRSLAMAALLARPQVRVAMKRRSAMLAALAPARLPKFGERVCTYPGTMTCGGGVPVSRWLVGVGSGRFALAIAGHFGAAAAPFHLAPTSPLATGAIEIQQRAFWGGCALADQLALGAAE
jgi:hypothetical protein